MQAVSTQPQSNRNVITLAIIGTLAVAALAIVTFAVIGDVPSVRQNASAPVIVPQVSADAAYTIESELAFENLNRAQAAERQMTADMGYALEVDQVALQQATQAARLFLTSDAAYATEADQITAQHAAQSERLFLTSDEGFAIEQALMTEQARHIAGTSTR